MAEIERGFLVNCYAHRTRKFTTTTKIHIAYIIVSGITTKYFQTVIASDKALAVEVIRGNITYLFIRDTEPCVMSFE